MPFNVSNLGNFLPNDVVFSDFGRCGLNVARERLVITFKDTGF